MNVANSVPGHSVAMAYLPSSVLKRPNLTIAVRTVVEKILFDESGSEPRAIGVEVSKSPVSPKYHIKANREVIICGGAVATPHILLVSGIGPKKVLSEAGIKVVKDLSQVGKNYYDVSCLTSANARLVSTLCIAHFIRSHLLARQARIFARLPQHAYLGSWCDVAVVCFRQGCNDRSFCSWRRLYPCRR